MSGASLLNFCLELRTGVKRAAAQVPWAYLPQLLSQPLFAPNFLPVPLPPTSLWVKGATAFLCASISAPSASCRKFWNPQGQLALRAGCGGPQISFSPVAWPHGLLREKEVLPGPGSPPEVNFHWHLCLSPPVYRLEGGRTTGQIPMQSSESSFPGRLCSASTLQAKDRHIKQAMQREWPRHGRFSQTVQLGPGSAQLEECSPSQDAPGFIPSTA